MNDTVTISAEARGELDKLVADELMEWGRAWQLDGDVVRCRACKRGIHYSKRMEPLQHKAECQTWGGYPWKLLCALAPLYLENAERSGPAAQDSANTTI